MLPDPKDVASGIKHLFRSKEEKRNAVELGRDLKLAEGKRRITAYIARQREMIPRLRGLAKKALAMGDEARFQQIGKQIIWTEDDIARWDKYSLTLDILESRRDQARASADLIGAVRVMTESMSDLTGPGQVSQLQQQLDKSLEQASAMDEGITGMMEGMDAAMARSIPADENALEKLRESLGDEIVSQGAGQLDKDLENGLNNLRSRLSSDMDK